MAGTLRTAERAGILFPNPQEGYSKFFRPGRGIPPTPSYSRPLLKTIPNDIEGNIFNPKLSRLRPLCYGFIG